MADRSHLQPPKHDPRAWDNDDNKPVIPKIPGPRAPRTSPRALAIRAQAG